MAHFPDYIPEQIRSIIRRCVKDIEKIVPDPATSVVLYGSYARGDFSVDRSNINLLVVAPQFSLSSLQTVATQDKRWRKDGIVAPLLLTDAELHQSLNLFPLEFLEMIGQHLLLSGRDPFIGCQVNHRNLQVQCEQGMWGILFRLRQQFIEGAGRPEAIQALLPISLTALVPCLRGILRILERPSGKTVDETLHHIENQYDLFTANIKVLREVLDMKRGTISPGVKEMPRLFERYLGTIEAIVHDVQALKNEGHL